MATATKTKREPEKVMTFEELNTKKLREKIEAYRDYVRRTAEGEMLSEEALEAVSEILGFLHLPDYCWGRDIQALRDHKQVAAEAAAMNEKRPDLDSEATALVAKIAKLEEELKQAKTRLNYCGRVSVSALASQLQRKHELETVHPHLLAEIGLAVKLRAEAREKFQAKQVPAKQLAAAAGTLEGWST